VAGRNDVLFSPYFNFMELCLQAENCTSPHCTRPWLVEPLAL